MRNMFTEINKKLHADIDRKLKQHSERCTYDGLKALALFDLKACCYPAEKWFGDSNTLFTQQWPSSAEI